MIILNPFSQSADQQSLPVEQRMLRFSKDLSILSDYDLMQHIQPIRHREQFQNWGQSARCQPLAVMRPNTEEEVQLVIELARRQGREIRCFGAGHSPSDLVCSSDYMMNLDRLSGLIKVDKASGRMEVFGGTRLHNVNQLAASHGLAFSTLGSISDQSIAGAVSTATHGCGARFGNLSTFVRSLTLILADASQIVVSEDEGQDVFRATLCGLGSTGVITRVELQLEPAFRLEEVVTEMSFKCFLDHFEAIGVSAEHVRIYWFPQLDKVRIERLNRTDKAPTPSQGRLRSAFNSAYTHFIHPFNLLLGRSFPSLIQLHASLTYQLIHRPPINEDIPQTDSESQTRPSIAVDTSQSKVESRVADSVSIFNFDCGAPHHTYEGAVPYSKTPSVLRHMDRWIKAEMSKPDGIRSHFPLEIRPVAADEIWLSPSYQTPSTYIGMVQYKPFGQPVAYKRLFAEFEAAILDAGGRPHWAKAHTCSLEQLHSMYPRLNDFLKLRSRLDPHGRFLNPYIRRHLLGQVGEDVDMRRFKARL